MIGIVFYFVNSGFLSSDKPESQYATTSSSSSSSPPTTNSHPVANIPSKTSSSSSSSSSNINGSKSHPNIVKPSSYQLFLSLPLYSNTVSSKPQIITHTLLLNQNQNQNYLSNPANQHQFQLFSFPSLSPSLPLVLAQSNNKNSLSNYQNLTVAVKSIKVLNENNVKSLQLALDVHNPNKGAAILETLNYNVYLNNVRLASADIGSKPEGFVDSLSDVFPIIGNQTISLKDTQPLTPDGSSLFDSNGVFINNNSTSLKNTSQKTTTNFLVNGTFSTTLDRGTQSQSSETPYSLQFPLK
jgi:hypothetical protein